MEPWQSRCIGCVNGESASSYVTASKPYSFSIEINRENEGAGDKLRFDCPLIRRGGFAIFAGCDLLLLAGAATNTGDRTRFASCIDSVSASFITAPGTHFGNGIRR